MARSIASMCFAYEIESVYTHTSHTERERGQACRCVGGAVRVCALAVKCSRTGCRRRVHRGPGRPRELRGSTVGTLVADFFKDPACYGSETEARNVNKRSAVRLDVWNSR